MAILLEVRTGISLADIDAAALAATMAEIEEEAQPPEAAPEEERESWTAFDIARRSLSVASTADPTGVVGVACTYPKCGIEEARTASAGRVPTIEPQDTLRKASGALQITLPATQIMG